VIAHLKAAKDRGERVSQIAVKTLHAKIVELAPTNDFYPVCMQASLRSLQTFDCDRRAVAEREAMIDCRQLRSVSAAVLAVMRRIGEFHMARTLEV
jgi:hypothetical protein